MTDIVRRRFAEARKPGIYKDEYIQALFEYYHETRPEFGPHAVLTPLEPRWKREKADADALLEADAAAAEEGGAQPAAAHWQLFCAVDLLTGVPTWRHSCTVCHRRHGGHVKSASNQFRLLAAVGSVTREHRNSNLQGKAATPAVVCVQMVPRR